MTKRKAKQQEEQRQAIETLKKEEKNEHRQMTAEDALIGGAIGLVFSAIGAGVASHALKKDIKCIDKKFKKLADAAECYTKDNKLIADAIEKYSYLINKADKEYQLSYLYDIVSEEKSNRTT